MLICLIDDNFVFIKLVTIAWSNAGYDLCHHMVSLSKMSWSVMDINEQPTQ